jgi:protein TonB
MFDDTLHTSWDERSRRGLTTLTSFGLQVVAAAVLLVLPLLRPVGLPLFRQISTPISLGRPTAEPPATRPHAGGSTAAPINPAIFLRPPSRLDSGMPRPSDDGPGDPGVPGPYIPGGAGPGGPGGVLSSLGGSRPIMPVAPPPLAPPVRISHMNEGDLIHKVLPVYPPIARTAGIQGQVVLLAGISKEGAIENLRVLAGHPILVPAAIAAVRQWRYRPYVLNNEPVEVETQITVNFSLGRN